MRSRTPIFFTGIPALAGLAALLAYVTNRRLVLGHRLLGFLAMTPIVIPGTVLAVALAVGFGWARVTLDLRLP